MPDSNLILALAGFAFVLAGFVKGVLGQGLPTVAVGLLSLAMTPVEAASLLVVPSLVTNIWQLALGPNLRPLVRRLWPRRSPDAAAPRCSTARAACILAGP